MIVFYYSKTSKVYQCGVINVSVVKIKTNLLVLQTHKKRPVCLFNYLKSVFKQVDEKRHDQLPDIPIICEDHLSSMCLIILMYLNFI